MKLPGNILSRRKFIASSLLGGLIAPILKSERAEGTTLAGFHPQVNISTLPVSYDSVNMISTLPNRLAVIGHFSVLSPQSVIEIIYQGRLLTELGTTGIGVVFELRVSDPSSLFLDLPPIANTGRGWISPDNNRKIVRESFTGIWQNLPIGDHTVNMWTWGADAGSVGPVMIGSTDSSQTDEVIIKEYLPFGSNFLPTIMK